MHYRVDRFVSDSRDPLHAHVELKGGLKVTPHGANHGGKAELTFEDVAVTVVTDGAELARLTRRCIRSGAGSCTPRAAGRWPTCTRSAVVSGPRGNVTVDGMLGRGCHRRALEARAWLRRRIDPAADWGLPGHPLPHGASTWRCAPAARGKQGEIIVERLDGGRRRQCTSRRTGAATSAGAATLVRRRRSTSLAAFGDVGMRVDGLDELDGRVAVDATLGRDAAGPRLQARVRGDGLALRHDHLSATVRRGRGAGDGGPGRPMTAPSPGTTWRSPAWPSPSGRSR